MYIHVHVVDDQTRAGVRGVWWWVRISFKAAQCFFPIIHCSACICFAKFSLSCINMYMYI